MLSCLLDSLIVWRRIILSMHWTELPIRMLTMVLGTRSMFVLHCCHSTRILVVRNLTVYICWQDSLQAFSSSIAGMLSSRAVLEGTSALGSSDPTNQSHLHFLLFSTISSLFPLTHPDTSLRNRRRLNTHHTNSRSPPLHPAIIPRPHRHNPVRLSALLVPRTRMQELPFPSRHLQRHGYRARLHLACTRHCI